MKRAATASLRLAGLIGVLTDSPPMAQSSDCAIPRMHAAGMPADTIDLRWIVLAKWYRLAAPGWT
jgi:hypothetical protein